jgi:glucan phosphoethanolaminetransferase (alkaline phosphatase superfamily)
MQSATVAVSGVLILSLAFVAGIIVLQVFLSKKESKWAGLILPIISFCISLLTVLGIIFFSAHTGTTTTTVDGEVFEQTVNLFSPTASIIASAAIVFLLYNIPTVVLILIYQACRGKQKRQRALEKMSAQDLG